MDAFRALAQAPCRVLPPTLARRKAKEAQGLKTSSPARPAPSSATAHRAEAPRQQPTAAPVPGRSLQPAQAWRQAQDLTALPWIRQDHQVRVFEPVRDIRRATSTVLDQGIRGALPDRAFSPGHWGQLIRNQPGSTNDNGTSGRIACRSRLGGLLNYYHREAA